MKRQIIIISSALMVLLFFVQCAPKRPAEIRKPDHLLRPPIPRELMAYGFNKRDYGKFRGWIEETIQYSKENGTSAIVVDKFAYRLFLYNKGGLVMSFPVEFGWNPRDDKTMQWDGRTPEGRYRVIMKRDLGESDYYRALYLDYPNEDDRVQYKALRSSGIIPEKRGIGGDIEIHGNGSGVAGNDGGKNWTAGCVAVSNRHMDILFSLVKEGTLVTIVKYGTLMIPD